MHTYTHRHTHPFRKWTSSLIDPSLNSWQVLSLMGLLRMLNLISPPKETQPISPERPFIGHAFPSPSKPHSSVFNSCDLWILSVSQDACIGHDNRLYQLVKKQCVGFEVKPSGALILLLRRARLGFLYTLHSVVSHSMQSRCSLTTILRYLFCNL